MHFNENDFYELMILETKWHVPKHFIDLKSVGHGGFGVVCSAFDIRYQNLVILKKLTRPFETKDHARRTYREIKLLKHISHHNLIQLIGIFCDSNLSQNLNDIYLITSYMEMTLHDRLYKYPNNLNALNEDYKMIYTYQILSGLRYLHSCNIIHRDLKPSNITISDRELKIIDLGLARQENFDMTGYVATKWYRAPEVMFQWQHYTRTIDVWSAGCVLAELYTRRPIFKSQNHSEHLGLIIKAVGYPNDAHLALWDSYAKDFIKQFKNIEVISDFSQNFPEIDSNTESGKIVIDLIKSLLKLNPNERFNVSQAIKHPYLAKYYLEDDEVNGEIFNDPHENIDHNISEWRNLIFSEIISNRNSEPQYQASNLDFDDQMLPS